MAAFRATIVAVFVAALSMMAFSHGARAQATEVTAYFFYGEGCPYCAAAEQYLSAYKVRNPDIQVRYFETWNNEENDALMEYLLPRFGGNAAGVPRLLIGNRVIAGFDENATPAQIDAAVSMARSLENPDPAEAMIAAWRAARQAPVVATEPSATGGISALGKAIAAVAGLLVVAVGATGRMMFRMKNRE